jgi:hypothetical protein
LLDYVTNTPADGWSSAASVNTINNIIDANTFVKAEEKQAQEFAK